MKLSIIMPFYNEKATLSKIINSVLNLDLNLEIIAINDGSTDGSEKLVETLCKTDGRLALFHHKNNMGKGAAIRTGIPHCTGDIITIQDADLETNPQNLIYLIKPIVEKETKVLYGSRVLGYKGKTNSVYYYGGRLVTLICNLLYNQRLTDEATCYKLFDAALLKSIPLNCMGFEFCPEVTAKVSKRGIKIKELPMDYYPRSKKDGKKLSWTDGLVAVWVLIKYRFVN